MEEEERQESKNRKGTWRAVRAQQCADQWECPHSLALSHRGVRGGGVSPGVVGGALPNRLTGRREGLEEEG